MLLKSLSDFTVITQFARNLALLVLILFFMYLSWVGIAQLVSRRLRAGWPRGRSSSRGMGKIFLLSTSFRPVLGPTQPPVHWLPRAISPEVKRLEREGDHSPLTSAKVKNTCTWIYTSTHTSSWSVARLVKHRDNFTYSCVFLLITFGLVDGYSWNLVMYDAIEATPPL
jgi:hypothetical protein